MAFWADVHCHIIPGVDDGAKDISTALELLRMEYEDNVRSLIVTPHYRRGMFETPRETIIKQFLMLKKEASHFFPDMIINLGCEFHVNMDMIDLLEERDWAMMAGTDYVLTEFSEAHNLSYIWERCYSLLCNGYIPIIAHAERYSALYKKYDEIEKLVDLGAMIQMNASSIMGADGLSMKGFCKKIMKMNLLHFVGSDAHNLTDRKPCIGKCAAYMEKVMGEKYTKRILSDNPASLIKEKRE
ncbi:MAG: CpsB/CapC family capsule biosynthesis tyrosine phosphatase [Oliverpabstia sp.]